MSITPRVLGLIALLLGPISGYSAVQVAGTTPTQAVIVYDASPGTSCRIEISESPTYSPLVADVDPALFAGADMDSRSGVLSNRLQRVFVAGKHGMNSNTASNAFLAADGKRHSRALQAGTMHYYRITCGRSVMTGSFTTAGQPLGNTYGEPAPVDASRPGAYNWPDLDHNDRRERVLDPLTGSMIRKIGVPSDTSPFTSGWTDAGAFSLCSHVPVNVGSSAHYVCYVPSSYAGTLVSIDTATGDAIPLTSMLVPYLAVGNDATLPCSTSVAFDGTVGTRFYCISAVSGKTALLMGDWTGPVDTPSSGFNGTSPNAMLRWTNLTPAPNDLKTLVARFDPLYTPERQAGVGYYRIVGQQKGKIIIRLVAAQNDSGWVLVFDPGNGQPVGSGGTGGIVASLPVWASPAGRWCGLHTVIGNGDTPWVSAVVNNLGSYSSDLLGGPYRVRVAGPSGDIAPGDTLFTVQAQNGIYEPVDPTPGEPSGYLMDAQPGDLFFIDRNGDGVFNYNVDEYVELVSKDPVTHTWTMRRGDQMSSSPFYQGTGLPLWSNSAIGAPAGAYLYAACRAQSLSVQASATLWWNFETDPHGRTKVLPAVNGSTSPQVIEHSHTGAHSVTRNDRNVMADSFCFGRGGVCWTGWTQSGGVPGLSTLGPPTYSNALPSFEGVVPPGGSNVYQQHPSYEQVNAPDTERNWTLDRMPLIWGSGVYGVSQRVTGTASVYQVSGATLHRDKLATLATCGTRVLRDISSSAIGVRIADETPYTYCVAARPSECRSGSVPGDVFVSCPGANYRFGGDPDTTIQCAAAPLDDPNSVDICAGDVWPYAQSVVQGGLSATGSNGELNRVVTQGFSAYHEAGSTYANALATPDGAWAMFFSSVTGEGLAYLAKIAPQPAAPDTIRRDGFIPVPLTLTPPIGLAGVQNAIVEFGYLENGGPDDYFCTSRHEACVKGNQPGNTYNWAGDGAAGQPCLVGCTIAIPLIPGRAAYYRVKYRDFAGTVLGIGETGIATEAGASVLRAAGTPLLLPAAATLGPGQSQLFQFMDGLGAVPATWSLSPAVGTLSADGVYTAPAVLTSTQTVTVTATDSSDPNRVARVTITLRAPAPTLASVSPASGMSGTSVTVMLTGSNFQAGSTVSVSNPSIMVSGVNVVSPTQIQATFAIAASAAAGTGNVTVSTAGGTSAAAVFTITLPPPPPPPVAIRVNAGGGASLSGGASWAADNNFSGGDTWSAPASTGLPEIYQSVRYGDDFTYAFDVPNGNYTVNLKFAEITQGRVGDRVFNVYLNDSPALTNFDILAASGAQYVVVDKSFPVAVSGGRIAIHFTRGAANSPMVNAIEIVPFSVSPWNATVSAGGTLQLSASMPVVWSASTGSISAGGLYTAPATVVGLQSATLKATSAADGTLSVTVPITLQPGAGGGFTPIRVNAGGGAYTDSKGRTWSADTGFSGGLTWQQALPVTGTDISPVLQSARYGNLFTYSFPVPDGPRVVNLYFAEISEVAPGQRVFNVSINGTPVLTNFDVFVAAKGRLKAIVKSFPVKVTGGMLQIQFSRGPANSAMVEALEIQ